MSDLHKQQQLALLNQLQHYLSSLSAETRKKSGNIKDAAERGLARVKSLQQQLLTQQEDAPSQLIQSHEELIKPFIIACESKNTKWIVIALSALQHLILHGVVPIGGLNIIVETGARIASYQHHVSLKETGTPPSSSLPDSGGGSSSTAAVAVSGGSNASVEEQQVQLKIIQLGLTIVTSTALDSMNQTTIFKILGIFFRLQGFNVPNVFHTSSAAIRQTTTLLYQKALDSQQMQMAHMFLLDLCLFVEGESGQSLNIHHSEISRPFVLELLDSIIDDFSGSLLQYPEFVSIFKERICTIVSNHLASTMARIANASPNAKNDYPTSLRLYRICRSLLIKFETTLSDECSTFLNLLSQIMEKSAVGVNPSAQHYATWNKSLVLEIFRGLNSDPRIFRNMFAHYQSEQSHQQDPANHVFARVMGSIQSCTKRILVDMPITKHIEYIPKRFNRLDNILHDDESVTVVTLDEIINGCMDCVAGVVSTISILSGIRDDPRHHKKDTELKELEESRSIAVHIIQTLWGSVLSISSMLLDRCEDEEALQAVLRIFLLFTHSCGVMGMASARDAFLSSLCRYAPRVNDFSDGAQDSSPTTPTSTTGMVHRLLTQQQQQQQANNDSFTSMIVGDHVSAKSHTKAASLHFSKKHVLVMRVLFNIAHCLGGLLGSSWFVLMKHFESLDRMLQAYNVTSDVGGIRTNTISSLNPTTAALFSSASNNMAKDIKGNADMVHHVGNVHGGGMTSDADSIFALREDLKILANALSNLFASIRTLDDESLAVILKSLHQLTVDTLGSDNDATNNAFANTKVSAAKGAGGGGGARDYSSLQLFGTTKLMQVVENNLFRIERIWEYVSQHILFLMDHENATVRHHVIDSFLSVIQVAYKYEQDIIEADTSHDHKNDDSDNDTNHDNKLIISSDFEHKLFALLQYIYEGCTHKDTKEQVLQSLTGVIHKTGQQFKGRAWPLILTILRRSLDDSPARVLIPLAFKSLQLIGKEMLPNFLSAGTEEECTDYLKLYIESCDRFARQSTVEDINLSLVSIGQLWSFSDFLSTEVKESSLNDSMIHELWIALFSELKLSCVDSRPEVRNSSLRTLAFVMSSHGGSLSLDGWEELIHSILLPVLDSIESSATQAVVNEAEKHQQQQQQQLQHSKEETQMQQQTAFVHHSRNSAVKQWSETRCLVIESLSRLIKEHGRILSKLPNFIEGTIPILCDHIYKCNLIGASEISKITIRSLLDVISSTDGLLRNRLWRCCCWQIFDLLVDDCRIEKQKRVDSNDVQFMVEGMKQLFEKDRENATKEKDEEQEGYVPLFEMEDVEKLLDMVMRLMVAPVCMDVLSLPSLLHKSCIELIRSLSAFPSPNGQTCELIFNRVVSVLPSPSSVMYHLEWNENVEHMEMDSLEHQKLLNEQSLYPRDLLPPKKFAVAILDLVCELCFDVKRVPTEARRRLLHRFVVCLDYLMLTRFISLSQDSPSLPKKPSFSHYYTTSSDKQDEDIFAYSLWHSAVDIFVRVITENISEFNNAEHHSEALWEALCQAIGHFFFDTRTHQRSTQKDDQGMSHNYDDTHNNSNSNNNDNDNNNIVKHAPHDQSGDQEEMKLVHLIERQCLTNCDHCSEHVLHLMLSVIEQMTHTSPRPVAHEALSCLFRIVRHGSESLREAQGSHGGSTVTIARLAIPYVVRRTQSILKDFIREEMRTGQMPLPRYRRDEVSNVLHELKESEVHESLFQDLNKQQQQPNATRSPGLDGKKGLVVRLFPVLGEFIACPTLDNSSIRTVLLEMFRIVSREVGIPDDQ